MKSITILFLIVLASSSESAIYCCQEFQIVSEILQREDESLNKSFTWSDEYNGWRNGDYFIWYNDKDDRFQLNTVREIYYRPKDDDALSPVGYDVLYIYQGRVGFCPEDTKNRIWIFDDSGFYNYDKNASICCLPNKKVLLEEPNIVNRNR